MAGLFLRRLFKCGMQVADKRGVKTVAPGMRDELEPSCGSFVAGRVCEAATSACQQVGPHLSHESGPMIFWSDGWEHGMLCDSCDQPFGDGDFIEWVEALGVTNGGIPIEGGPCCPRCWSAR